MILLLSITKSYGHYKRVDFVIVHSDTQQQKLINIFVMSEKFFNW